MRKAWAFLSEPKNLAVLALLGGAVAFLWGIVEPRLFPPPMPPVLAADVRPGSGGQTAIASGLGAQAGNADNQSVIGDGAPVTGAGTIPTAPPTQSNQRAEARDGAKAFNATGGSRITVERPANAEPSSR